MARHPYLELLGSRTVVFDGAMGTSIQARRVPAEAYGGPGLEGCVDHLTLSAPEIIRDIHASFLDVGCDVIETNTFRANRLALKEYDLQDRVAATNRAAAALARDVADEFSTASRPRFVAGSIGPSGFLPSSSEPDLGSILYEELVVAYQEQAGALLSGGADLLLIETGQDLLEVRAAITGCRRAMRDRSAWVPLQAQVTLDTSGRMLLGTSIGAAMVTLEALRVDVLGLNCSTGPEPMRESVRYLAAEGRTPISVIPNAGIPRNQGGEAVYPLDPDGLAAAHREFVQTMGVAVVGGCCGTTPDHLRAVVEAVEGIRRGRSPSASGGSVPRVASAIRAADLRQIPPPTFIGERINAQGSRRVKELLLAGDFNGLLQVARAQVDGGAHILDVCVAVTERDDEADQARALFKLLSQGVEAPLMVDTTEVEVAVAALRQAPGRSIVNSVNLEGGRSKLDRLLPHVVEHGAALVVLTIDEQGMARTAGRKVEIASRILDICVTEFGLRAQDVIIDALTFTLATGEEEYASSALETLEAIRRIKRDLPGVLTSLGVSNVSFGLQPQARPVLNSVFLHHAVEAGLDMAIVNPAQISPYLEIDPEARGRAEDLIFHRRNDALSRFISLFEGLEVETVRDVDPLESLNPREAIRWMVLHRKRDGIEARVEAAIRALGGGHDGAVATLNQVLLPAMKEVGDRFGAGDLILPFVLQSAEVMKAAVTHLEGFLERSGGQSKGTVVLATVLGDVHDIGKNLVHTILENNGYTVHNLGKQVPVNTVLEKARELEADAIGLSALLVSTSKQMPLCVQELHRRGLSYPVLVGGAAINPSFVRQAARVEGRGGSQEETGSSLYPHGVFYCKDAFDGLAVMDAITDPDRREDFLSEWAAVTRSKSARRAELTGDSTRRRPTSVRPPPSRDVVPPEPPFLGPRVLDEIPLEDLFPLVDRNTLYRLHWGAKNADPDRLKDLIEAEFGPRLQRYQEEAVADGWIQVKGAYGYFRAGSRGNEVVVFDPEASHRAVAAFPFPRQASRERLCLSDFFRPLASAESGPSDLLALQIVTVRSALLEDAGQLLERGAYSDGYYRHGFGVRLAEAAAEYVHRTIRRDLGLSADRGLRYSWGYGACPDTLQHRTLFRLLPARERLGMDLTEFGVLVPELSTAAIVVHHPDARYFRV